MSFAAGQPMPWPVPPDWDGGITEGLEWRTDWLQARNGRAQKRELRQTPRRTFEFSVIADEQARRVVDAILNANGSGDWLLPIWHDVQRIDRPLAGGVARVPCATAGREFSAGGQALLWLALNQWVVLIIDAIETDALLLRSGLPGDWPVGSRLYPLRRAHLTEQPEETVWTDASGARTLRFLLDEVSEWPAALPAATYRGFPVLEMRPDEGEDPKAVFNRLVDTIDAGTGAVSLFDGPARAFHEISVNWLAHGRTPNATLRSLLYALRGRMQTLWVPTWTSDLRLTADIAAAATFITVEWAGYTVFGAMRANRRDIRIELNNGSVFYRRITSAQEAGASELLGIDSALGVSVSRHQVRAIGFLMLAEQASDHIELKHVTDADGLTSVATRFIGVRHDV